MKIRRINLSGGVFGNRYTLDFNNNGNIDDIIGISGGHKTGKTLITKLISNIYSLSVRPKNSLALHKNVTTGFNGYRCEIEFEDYNGISVGVLENNTLIQPLKINNIEIDDKKFNNGLLVYDSLDRVCNRNNNSLSIREKMIIPIINDLNNSITNSIVIIDDIDFGLDIKDSSKFIFFLIQNLLVKNNQLIFFSNNSDVFSSLPVSNCKFLGQGKNILEELKV